MTANRRAGRLTGGAVVIGLGDDVTCTINNDDNAPALHLRKTVTNDNGGGALVTDWTLNADGQGANPTDLSGDTPVDSGPSFKADTTTCPRRTAPRATPPRSGAAWTRHDEPVASTGGTVVIGLGDNVTCTINNDDNAPALHLRKTVTNDNGGAALVTDWTLNADGQGRTRPTCPGHPGRQRPSASTPTPTRCPRPTAPRTTPPR